MRWRILLLLSLLANVALAVGLFVYARHAAARRSVLRRWRTPNSAVVKTNFVVRRQFLSWSHVESTDYPHLHCQPCAASVVRKTNHS